MATARMARYLALVWLAIVVQHISCSDDLAVVQLEPGDEAIEGPESLPQAEGGGEQVAGLADEPPEPAGGAPPDKEAGTKLMLDGDQGLCVGTAGLAEGVPASVEKCESPTSENWVIREEDGLIQSVAQPELCLTLEKDDDFASGEAALVMSCRARPGAQWDVKAGGIHLRSDPSLVLSLPQDEPAAGQQLQLVAVASAKHKLNTALHVNSESTLKARYTDPEDGTIGSNFGGCASNADGALDVCKAVCPSGGEECPCNGNMCYVPETEAMHWCDQIKLCEVVSTNPQFSPAGWAHLGRMPVLQEAPGTWSSVMQITDSTPSGGTISLAGAGDGAFCVGVQGSLAAASAVELQSCSEGEPKQLWVAGETEIHSGVDASLCVTTPPGVAPSGQALVLGSCSSLADQTMLVSPTGQIKLGESGPCVTVEQGVAADGTALKMQPCGPAGERSQQWALPEASAASVAHRKAAEEADVSKLVDAANAGEVKEIDAKKKEKEDESKELADRKTSLEKNSADAAHQTQAKLEALRLKDQKNADKEKAVKAAVKARVLHEQKKLAEHRSTIGRLRSHVAQLLDTHSAAEAKMRLTEADTQELKKILDAATMKMKSLQRSQALADKHRTETVESATKANDEVNRLETGVNALMQEAKATTTRLNKASQDASRRMQTAKDASVKYQTSALEHAKTLGPRMVKAKGAAARAQVVLSRAEEDAHNGASEAAMKADSARERLVQTEGLMSQMVADAKEQEHSMRTEQIPSTNTLSEQHLKQLQDSLDTAQRDSQEAINAATLAQQAVKHTMTLATKRREELQGQRTIKAATAAKAKLMAESYQRKVNAAEDQLQVLVNEESAAEEASTNHAANAAVRAKAKAEALKIKLSFVKTKKEKLLVKKKKLQHSVIKLVADEKLAGSLVVQTEDSVQYLSNVARAAQQAKANAQGQAEQAKLDTRRLEASMTSAIDIETQDINEAESALQSTKQTAKQTLNRKRDFFNNQADKYDEKLQESKRHASSLEQQLSVAESSFAHLQVAMKNKGEKDMKQVHAAADSKAQAISRAQKTAAKEQVWLNDDYKQKEEMAADDRKATVDAAQRSLTEASRLLQTRASQFDTTKLDSQQKLEGIKRQVDHMVATAQAAADKAKARADKVAGDLLNKAKEEARNEREVERSMPSEDQMPVSDTPSCGCGGGELGEGETDSSTDGCPCAEKKPVSSEPDPIPAGRGAGYAAAADALAKQEALAQSVEDTVALGKKEVAEAKEQLEAVIDRARQMSRAAQQDSDVHTKRAELAHEEAAKAVQKAKSFVMMASQAAKAKYDVLAAAAKNKVKNGIESSKNTLRETIERANAEYAAAESQKTIAVKFDAEEVTAQNEELETLKATLRASKVSLAALQAKSKDSRAQNQIELQKAESEYTTAMKAAEELQNRRKSSTSVNVETQKKKYHEGSKVQLMEQEAATNANDEESTARAMIDLAKKSASHAKNADTRAEDVRVAADQNVHEIDSELEVVNQAVRNIGAKVALAEKQAAGGGAASGISGASSAAALADVKARMLKESGGLRAHQAVLAKASARASDLQYASNQVSAKLEEMLSPQPKQLAAEDASRLARSRAAHMKTLSDAAIQKLADATSAAAQHARRLKSQLQQLQDGVVQKLALQKSRVTAAQSAVAQQESRHRKLAAEEEVALGKLLTAQKKAEAASAYYTDLQDKDEQFRRENFNSVQSAEEEAVLGSNERDQTAAELAKYNDRSKRAMGAIRLQLDSARSSAEYAKSGAEAASKDQKRVAEQLTEATDEQKSFKVKYEALDTKLQAEKESCDTMMRACRTQGRLLGLAERKLESLEHQQTWRDVKERKDDAHKQSAEARQAANDASDALLVAQRAAADQKQRANDLKKAMEVKATSEEATMLAAARAKIASLQESSTQTTSEAEIEATRANGDMEVALKQSSRARHRSNTQRTAADEKVNIAQARAAKQEDIASRLKSKTATIRLHASQATKAASEVRQAQAMTETARQAAEVAQFEMRKESEEIRKSWHDRLQTAKLNKANVTGTLTELKGELHTQEYNRDKAQNAVDAIQKKQHDIEQTAHEEANIAKEAIRVAKAEEQAKRGEFAIMNQLAKQKSEEELAVEERELAHRLNMEKMVMKTNSHVSINHAIERGVWVQHNAQVKVLRHKGLKMTAEARHGSLTRQSEVYKQIADDARATKASFDYSAQHGKNFDSEMEAIEAAP